MKLEPGYYKIRKHDYSEAYGKKHPRPNPNTIHILFVTAEGECFVDHSLVSISKDAISEYEIISKYATVPIITKCAITLSFEDSSGAKFAWRVRDTWALRKIFDFAVWLRKPFGYEPKR